MEGCTFVVLFIFATGSLAANPDTECYPLNSTTNIPRHHLFYSKKLPLVIGHRGEIQSYQENSLEGMMHLIAIRADGMHMQVQLTKDKRLILFGDDNLKRMTGENFNVDQLPYSEIAKMKLQKTIVYGNITKRYSETLKIPLLVDVLEKVRANGLLIYIELVPSHVPPSGAGDRFRSLETGLEIGRIIRQMQLEKEVFVVSYDPFKMVSTAHENPYIALGWWVHRRFFTEATAAAIRKEFIDIPGLRECYQTTAPLVGAKFMEFVVATGIVQKAVNASVIDFDYAIYSNTSYFSESNGKLITVLKQHYNVDVLPGSFDVFDLKSSMADDSRVKGKVVDLVRQGLTRIITDDVNKVKVTLERALTGSANSLSPFGVLPWRLDLFMLCSVVMCVRNYLTL